jgi:hypothetical protein
MSWGTRSRGEAEQAEAVACRGNRAAALESREAAGAGRSEESRMAARRSGMETFGVEDGGGVGRFRAFRPFLFGIASRSRIQPGKWA